MRSRKSIDAIALALALFAVGCQATQQPNRIASDLIGHSTGGREKAWRFERGQRLDHIQHISTPAPYTHVISLHTDAGQGVFLQVLRLEYTPRGALTNVGQLHIEQLTNRNWQGTLKR